MYLFIKELLYNYVINNLVSVVILNEIDKLENKYKVFQGVNIFRLYYVYFLIIYIKGYMFLVLCKLECKEMFDLFFFVVGLGRRVGV